MDIEKSVSNVLHGLFQNIEATALGFVHLIFIPFSLSQPLFKFALFFLLVPPLFFLSFSASIALQAWVPVGWSEVVMFQYGDIGANMPYAHVSLPSLPTKQPFDISLYLLVPTSESNYALGNFMTTLRVYSPNNETLASSRIPSILPPRGSSIIPFLSNPSTVPLEIPLVRSFSSRTTSPLRAVVEIGRTDGWRSLGSGEGRELHVYSAELRGTVKLKGVWAFIANHPILASIATTSLFFVASLLSALLFYLFAPNISPAPEDQAGDKSAVGRSQRGKEVKKEEDEDVPGPALRRRSRTSSQTGPTPRAIKAEEDDSVFI